MDSGNGAITMQDSIQRVTELEIQLALQQDLLESLNDTVAKLQQKLDLQQGQLRVLYQRLNQDKADADEGYSLADEIPPHY